jgi:hypothetical protein
MHLRNIGLLQWDYTTLYPRKLLSWTMCFRISTCTYFICSNSFIYGYMIKTSKLILGFWETLTGNQYTDKHILYMWDCSYSRNCVCICLQLFLYRDILWTSHASIVVTWEPTTVLLIMECLLPQTRPSNLKFIVSTDLWNMIIQFIMISIMD